MIAQRLADKIAIVTGAATGIGEGVARRLHAEGATVVIADVNEPAAMELAASLGPRAVGIGCDVTRREDVERVVGEVVSRFGRLDHLCNNAGLVLYRPAAEIETEAWMSVMNVGMNAVFQFSRLVLPHLIKTGGSIVNIASISGLAADYGFSAYNASKGAIVNYTRSLAIEYAAKGVRVNSVCPGFTDTPNSQAVQSSGAMFQAWLAAIPMRRIGTPAEMGAAVAFLASDDASYITGVNLAVDGGITAWTGQPDIATFSSDGGASRDALLQG